MVSVISKVILLDPAFLTKNVKDHVKILLKSDINSCTFQDGYILEIFDFVINKIYISNATSKTLVNLTYKANTLKPEIGKVYECECYNITSDAIFVIISNILKVVVPIQKLEGYSYLQGTMVYKNFIIKKTMKFEVEILETRFYKNNYSCVGRLKNYPHSSQFD